MTEYVVVLETRSTRRRWYLSRVPGVGESLSPKRARRFSDRGEAERWARMLQADNDRGRGGRSARVEEVPS